jgi:hypothetical protein
VPIVDDTEELEETPVKTCACGACAIVISAKIVPVRARLFVVS